MSDLSITTSEKPRVVVSNQGKPYPDWVQKELSKSAKEGPIGDKDLSRILAQGSKP